MEEIDIKKDAFQKRWISYFDLLGFSDLVQTKGELNVFNTITTALEEFGRKRNPNDHFVERVCGFPIPLSFIPRVPQILISLILSKLLGTSFCIRKAILCFMVYPLQKMRKGIPIPP